MQQTIKDEGLEEWARYARVWVDRFAPESDKFLVKEEVPEETKSLSDIQKTFLQEVSSMLDQEWDAETFQKEMYERTKSVGINTKEAFQAIYIALLGKTHGPKAGWLILSLDKAFVKERFTTL